MQNIFRVPVDNQHFKDTIEDGKGFDQISKFLFGDQKEIEIHYKGFEIPKKYVVGFGLDAAEYLRGLNDIQMFDLSA